MSYLAYYLIRGITQKRQESRNGNLDMTCVLVMSIVYNFIIFRRGKLKLENCKRTNVILNNPLLQQVIKSSDILILKMYITNRFPTITYNSSRSGPSSLVSIGLRSNIVNYV